MIQCSNNVTRASNATINNKSSYWKLCTSTTSKVQDHVIQTMPLWKPTIDFEHNLHSDLTIRTYCSYTVLGSVVNMYVYKYNWPSSTQKWFESTHKMYKVLYEHIQLSCFFLETHTSWWITNERQATHIRTLMVWKVPHNMSVSNMR